jgi:hypothetical protein
MMPKKIMLEQDDSRRAVAAEPRGFYPVQHLQVSLKSTESSDCRCGSNVLEICIEHMLPC